MKFHTKRKHMIDIIFPIALFVVFALSALTVLLLAARIYRFTTENSALNYTARTGLSYISEKIHQNDVGGQVAIGELNGQEALVMLQEYDGTKYYTYIYVYDNELRELFIKEDAKTELNAGTSIMEIRDFSMEQQKEGLFRFTCTDQNDQTYSILVTVRSR